MGIPDVPSAARACILLADCLLNEMFDLISRDNTGETLKKGKERKRREKRREETNREKEGKKKETRRN